MIRNISRWIVPASILPALFALSACAGVTGPSVPVTPTQNTAFFRSFGSQEGLSALGAQQNASSCPSQFTAGCFTFSLSKGLKINWCYGPTSDQCSDTKKYKWSGNVCLAKATKCQPIDQLKAKWTGPFKCSKKTCSSSGYYKLDTVTKGSKPPKVTQQYLYKQDIHICKGASCLDYYTGINVSK